MTAVSFMCFLSLASKHMRMSGVSPMPSAVSGLCPAAVAYAVPVTLPGQLDVLCVQGV